MHLESDKHLVQIVATHKSKGLEYPLVWLPFIINFHVQEQTLCRDHHSFGAVLDPDAVLESVGLAEAEHLAEGLRLLYVMLTRSVWRCSLGVAPLVRRCGDKKSGTDVHQNALGHLLQRGGPQGAAGLHACIEALRNDGIAWQTTQTGDNQLWQVNDVLTAELNARTL